MRRTLIIVKPDAVNRGLIGRLIARFELKGLKVIGMKMEILEPSILEKHYEHHKDKAFFKELIKFMSSIPSVLMVLEGKEAVEVVRKMVGTTLGRDAEPGTIRGDYSMSNQQNIIHASASSGEADKEIQRFFRKNELHSYQKMNFDWVYSETEKE